MPLDKTTKDKIYVTQYSNFKGVDFTNDASNVFMMRSPTGKNMLPDIDGRPYKRTGWEIAISENQFKTLAGVLSTATVIPDKTYYFTLGGVNYLIIFNSLGVFYYDGNLHMLNKYKDNGAEYTFPPNGRTLDSKKAFFFEGGGTAGFYIFLGKDLFVFNGTYVEKVHPHIPTVLVLCSPDGTGTTIENVNILTRERIVAYACDGETTAFTLPGGYSGTPVVETRNQSTGDWEVKTEGSDYNLNAGKVVFTTAPAVVAQGEDNMRVTYAPDGFGATITENTTEPATKTAKIKKITIQHKYRYIHNGKISYSEWGKKLTLKSSGKTQTFAGSKVNYKAEPATFNTPNIKNKDTFTVSFKNDAGSFVQSGSSYYNASFDAYANRLSISPTKDLFKSSSKAESSTKKTNPSSLYTPIQTKLKGMMVSVATRTITEEKTYKVQMTYTEYHYTGGEQKESEALDAFSKTSKVLIFGNGIINQVFVTASAKKAYNTRVWYSAATDPSYFPDLNYIEVGSTDLPCMGLIKVDEYLGIIKQGGSTDTAVYLAYPTSFEETTTYAVKQSVNGIGAVSNGAFNILNDEPLFLSKEGVMGIEPAENEARRLRNRSHYVNKRLCEESDLESAISFVYDGMYWLAVNGNCYVLDGSQKNSWANTKTNLQYECYYLENIPAQCFAKFNGQLWFSDFKGNLCRFKSSTEEDAYSDAYIDDEPEFTTRVEPTDGTLNIDDIDADDDAGSIEEGSVIYGNGKWYTVTLVNDSTAEVQEGVGIDAVWGTIADDDGAPYYFKNMQKKGCLVSLLPSKDSGVSVYIQADSGERIFVGKSDAKEYGLPYDFYIKKKVKKYKRLQIICENNFIGDSFGVDRIVKSYTFGNYSKNKG